MDTEKAITRALEVMDDTKKISAYSIYNPNAYIVYKGTNENIKSDPYKSALRRKEDVLSVIGSGDQILNSILLDCKNIDAYDISIFPKYYLKLKMSAVKTLGYYDYLDFFFGSKPFDDYSFKKVVDNLDPETKHFWKEVVKGKTPRELYESRLFTGWGPSIMGAKFRNVYLDNERDYYRLRDKIDSPKIRYIDGDVYEFTKDLDKEYDLINLSNIGMNAPRKFYYLRDPNEPFHEFKSFVKNLKIRDNGLIINYMLNIDRDDSTILYDYALAGDEFKTSFVAGDLTGRIDAVNIYKKVR